MRDPAGRRTDAAAMAQLANLSPTKRALLERRLQAATAEPTGRGAARASSTDFATGRIAIVAMACRLPGGADSPAAFWELLAQGRDAVTAVPSERWEGEALFDADAMAANRIPSRRGGFLHGIDQFDAGFFGISPREAAQMDPQQRLLLELAWEALEAGGQPADQLAGSATGVFVGAHSHSNDYQLLQMAQAGGIESHSSTGSAHSILANRISYLFDLRGPSMTVDTACSSSLVAVHLACQSLRTGECDLALAGSANMMLGPAASFAFGKLQILSPDGRCAAFDADANGIVRGEGVALLVLKRLADAERDGDPILALVAGSAVNQDGASNGLTAPNGLAQQAVIRRALKMAGMGPERYGLIETHGTGTPLGDPVEVEALAAVIGPARDAAHRCYLGAVKTNLGHLEASAGIAGLIKAVACLQRGAVPPNLHLKRANPHLRLQGTPFAIPTELTPWPGGALARVAGISSFGFGGTNAHVVLEEYRACAAPDTRPAFQAALAAASSAATPPREHWLTVSARDAAALGEAARRTSEALTTLATGELEAVVPTARTWRSHHPWRIAVHGADPEILAQRLHSRLALPPAAPAVHPVARPVWVYSGQGGLWPACGRELYECEPVFKAALDEVAAAFERRAGWDLRPVLLDDGQAARFARTEVAQPAIFALQAALTALWRSLGLSPGAIVGHSVGEVAAAFAAGVLTLDDALAVVHERSRAMQPAFGLGRMAQVEAAEEELGAELDAAGGALSVAAINGPRATVLSGDPAALQACLARLATRGVGARELAVDYAFHSAQMQAFVPAVVRALAGIAPRVAEVPLVSTVSGRWCEPGEYGAAYWGRNVREPVRFAAAVQELLDAGYTGFVEIGPHPALGAGILALGEEAASAEAAPNALTVVATLRRALPARASMLASLCDLYEAGAVLDWSVQRNALLPVWPLPAYPWQRRRHWLGAADAATLAFHVTGRTPSAGLPAVAPAIDGRAGATLPSTIACYEMTWPLAAGTTEAVPTSAAATPTPMHFEIDAEASTLHTRAAAWPAAAMLAAEGGEHEMLERRGGELAWQALRELGLAQGAGELITLADGAARGVRPVYARLWRRLLQLAEQSGLLIAEGAETWRAVSGTPATGAGAPLPRTESMLMERCGQHLAAVLRGEHDALSLLFPGDGRHSAAEVYAQTPSAALYNRLAAEAVAALARSAGRPLRVLEIGAGTGATAAQLLPRLPACSHYCFTDLSPLFLHEAKERFCPGGREAATHSFSFRRLDIEQPPVAQGFEPAGFDLVVAANVLHATADLRRTVENVRSLLAPGGVLLLVETVARRAWADLTFGLTEGWWRFADAPLRHRHALLDGAQWATLLRASGFDGAAAIGGEFSRRAVHPQALVLARAQSMRAAVATAARPRRFAGQRWLVVADRSGFGERLAEALRTEGAICTCSAVDSPVPPATTELHGVVHCGALDAPTAAHTTLASLDPAIDTGLASAVAWTRQIAAAGGANSGVTSTRLWLVTRSAQARPREPGPDALAPAQSLVWGLGRSIALEHPALWGGLVDLDAARGGADDARNLAALVQTLAANDGEDQILVRDGQRHVARLAPRAMPPAAELRLNAQASYLVTGGYGGLGPRLALWLADQGARHIVLLGRHGPATAGPQATEFEQALKSLAERGVSCRLERADVANAVAVRSLFTRLADDGRAIGGIVHAAASIRFAALQALNPADLAEALRAKVHGAWVLHELSIEQARRSGTALDCFVLFSSATALFGAKGLAAYAAANQFLIGLAHQRAALGLAATCVDWGAWDEIRLLGRDNQADITRLGYLPMVEAEAFAALNALIASGVPSCMVASMDWPTATAAYQVHGRRPFLDGVARSANSGGGAAGHTAVLAVRPDGTTASSPFSALLETKPGQISPAQLRASLVALTPRARRDRVATLVREELARVLGLPGPQAVDAGKGFFDLGLDSLMAMQLRRQVGALLGLALPATVTFNHSSVGPLATHLLGLLGLLGQDEPGADPAAAATSATAAAGLSPSTADDATATLNAMSELSDEEVRRALSAELAAAGLGDNEFVEATSGTGDRG